MNVHVHIPVGAVPLVLAALLLALGLVVVIVTRLNRRPPPGEHDQ